MTVLDFTVRIYRYLGPSKNVTLDHYNTLEISWLDVNSSRNLRISKKKKKKITESDEIYQRAMVHPKETRESQKEFWDEGGVNRVGKLFFGGLSTHDMAAPLPCI